MMRSDQILHSAETQPASVPRRDIASLTAPVPLPIDTAKVGLSDFRKTDGYRRSLVALQVHRESLLRFLKSKWQGIQSARRKFGLADNRRYRVDVSAAGLRHLGVEAFEFEQRGHVPPAVGVALIIHHCKFPARIDSNGELRDSGTVWELYAADHVMLLNLAVVLLFFDLVVGQEAQERLNRPSASGGPTDAQSPRSLSPVVDRIIPRLSHEREPLHRLPGRAERHSSRCASQVNPFRRRLPERQKPSFEKVVEADQYGINLLGPGFPTVQYTFVRAHTRGTGGTSPDYQYRQDYRAAKTLESILSLVELE